MITKFFNNNTFKNAYLQLFITRFTIGNLEMEDKYTELTSPNRSVELYTNMQAMQKILDSNPKKVSPFDLIEVADIVNNGCYTKGFRHTQVDVKSAKNFFPINPKQLPQAIYSLFNAYHNIWTDLDIFEKEAKFHIELVRLQPFEDGNKRSARILTSYNLLKSDNAPIVISESQTDEYFKYIDEYDVQGMANLFRKSSEDELSVMNELAFNIGVNLDDVPTDDSDIKIYEKPKEDSDIKLYEFKNKEGRKN